MMTFVAFHFDLTDETLKKIKSVCPTFTYYDPEKFLTVMFQSASLFHPGCRKVVITDHQTPLNLPKEIEIIRYTINPNLLIIAICAAQIEFLKHIGDSSHLIFLDSDMIIQDNLESLFQKDFDLGLAYRPHTGLPINCGIFFIHRKGVIASAYFFARLLKAVLQKHRDSPSKHRAIWYGEQISIGHLIGGKEFLNTRTSDLLDVYGTKVLLVPADIYDFSTKDISRFHSDKKILHFKGNKKQFMFPYWEKYFISPKKEGNFP